MSKNKLNNRNFALWVAKRYLFSKKSHNAVNIISAISATGVCVGSIALVCVLSVFNGFEALIERMFSAFDPDLKITLVEGKVFNSKSKEFTEVKNLKSVISFAEVVEETALILADNRQMPATIKGVSNEFAKVTKIDSIIYDGYFSLYDGAFYRAVVGIGLATELGINSHQIDPLIIYAPKRTKKVNIVRPENSFTSASAYPAGVFVVNQPEYDNKLVIISVKLARQLFQYSSGMVTALELKISPTTDKRAAQRQIKDLLGDTYHVKNKYEQQENYFKITQIEKWVTYLILSFILLIAIFNIIGSLSMLILEKKEDIEILRSLGADNRLIKRIFMFEGWMISALGAVAGIVLGVVLVLIQQQFGILKLGENYVVDAYPVLLSGTDVLVALITVLALGFLAVRYPVHYVTKKNNL